MNTTDLTGEYEDRNFIVKRGDSRIAMTIAKNEDTVKLGRDHRFLIDDPDSPQKLSYALTKPLKLGNVYDNHGVYIFVLQEVVGSKYDNQKLGIADYYVHFPEKLEEDLKDHPPRKHVEDAPPIDDKEVWL